MTNTKQSAEIMDERKAFEAWAESSGRYFDLDCDVNQDGTVLYMHENARYAWAAWMERAVLSAQANDAKVQEDAKLTALKIAGSDLSNIAFNLAQRDGEVLEKHTCIILDSCRKSWDAAIQGMQTGSGE